MTCTSSYEWKMLGEVCALPEYGYTTSAEYHGHGPLLVRTTDISSGNINWKTVPFCRKPPINEDRYRLRPGDILIARAGTVGASTVVKNPLRAVFASYLIRFRPKKELNPLYAGFFLRSNLFFVQLGGKTAGTTLPGVNARNLSRVNIPIPPLHVQQRIASILEKCESAIQKRKEALGLTDEFLKSTFLDMFGDPVRNPKGWTVRAFGKIFNSIRYATGSPPPYQKQGIAFVRATDIKNGTIVSKNMKYISSDDARRITKCRLSHGNLVIVRSGVNAGDCGLVPEQFDGAYAAYDLIVELPYASAVFYNHLINAPFGKAMIAPLKRRAGQPHLNAEQVGSLELMAPPIAEQQKFADIVREVQKLKEKQRESEKELTNLFNSLMQRAFRGEL